MKAVVHTDGGARPTNPGHAGCGVVVTVGNQSVEVARYLGIRTNNQAEYIGAIIGIKLAAELGASELELVTDSKLVQGHLEFNWRVKEPKLRPLVTDARDLLQKLFAERWQIRWVRREENSRADALCTAAILKHQSENPFTRKARALTEIALPDPFART